MNKELTQKVEIIGAIRNSEISEGQDSADKSSVENWRPERSINEQLAVFVSEEMLQVIQSNKETTHAFVFHSTQKGRGVVTNDGKYIVGTENGKPFVASNIAIDEEVA